MSSFLKAAEVGTHGSMTLPGAFYTSLEIFRREQKAIAPSSIPRS